MLAHARAEFPNECCGLLSGCAATGAVATVHRLVNKAASPVRYFGEEYSLLAAHRAMWAVGADLLAIYHSHPISDPVPSRSDLANNFHGTEVVHFIVSLKGPEPVVRGWRLGEKEFTEAEWECAEG